MNNPHYHSDPSRDGVLVFNNPKTINRYYELMYKDLGAIPMALYLRKIHEKYQTIAKECDPQEVYCFEYNNHECMYDPWEGDYAAIELIIDIFGKDTAHKITRSNAVFSIDKINS